MELSEIQAHVAELEQQIAELPAGSVTKKAINGNVYFYHRWTENKKRREKYIPAEEVDSFRKQIERRKALEKELKQLSFKSQQETHWLMCTAISRRWRNRASAMCFSTK